GIPDDLAPRQFAIAGNAHLEGNRLTRQLSFGLTAERNLRTRVDAARLQTSELVGRLIEGMRRGKAALIHRGRGECRKTDHIADRVDVRHLSLRVGVHYKPSAMISFEPCKIEVQVGRIALPSRRVHDHLSSDLLSGRQRRDRAPPRALDRGTLLAETERHGVVPQMELQGFDDLGIAEVEHLVTLLDQRHSGAEGSEHRRVLYADDSGTDYDQ